MCLASSPSLNSPTDSTDESFLSVDAVLRAKQAENRTCFADELWQGSCAGVPHAPQRSRRSGGRAPRRFAAHGLLPDSRREAVDVADAMRIAADPDGLARAIVARGGTGDGD